MSDNNTDNKGNSGNKKPKRRKITVTKNYKHKLSIIVNDKQINLIEKETVFSYSEALLSVLEITKDIKFKIN